VIGVESRSRVGWLLIALFICLAVAACKGGVQGTSGISGPDSATVTITAISPVTASNLPQDVTITGTNFVSSDTVTVIDPSGISASLSGSQILVLSSTSIRVRLTFGAPGVWVFRVTHATGQQSNAFSLTVT
jgi:hypothetical protein